MNRYKSLAVIVLSLASLTLFSCSSTDFYRLDPRDLYKKFDGKYIDQVKPGTWSPSLHLEGGNDPKGTVFYLPDGVTMTRMGFQGLAQNRTLENYLNGIVAKLLAYSPVKGAKVRVILIGDDAYGATQSMPDGIIAMPLRFIHACESEDEIAWLLGHELSHILLRHHNADWVLEYQKTLLGTVENMLVLTGATVNLVNKMGANTEAGMVSGLVEKYNKWATIVSLSTSTLYPAWSRSQEEEADLLGLDLIAKAGYSVDEADQVLSQLEAWSGSEDKRREQQDEQAQAVFNEESITHADANSFFRELTKAWVAALQQAIGQLKAEITATHKDVAARRKALGNYMEREYEDDYNEPQTVTLRRILARRSVKRIMTAYAKAWNAEQAITNGDAGNAERLLRAGLGRYPKIGHDSYPRLVFFQIRATQGRLDKARKNLEIALRYPDASMQVYEKLYIMALGNNDYRKAESLVDSAWTEFEHPPQLYPIRIRLMRTLDRKDQRLPGLLLECQQRADQATRNKCRAEYMGKADKPS
jgi:predicted Zn-dependent protease